jgi:hypothetical protein
MDVYTLIAVVLVVVISLIVAVNIIPDKLRQRKAFNGPPVFEKFFVAYGAGKGFQSADRIQREMEGRTKPEGYEWSWHAAMVRAYDVSDCQVWGLKEGRKTLLCTLFGGDVKWESPWRPTKGEKVFKNKGRDSI